MGGVRMYREFPDRFRNINSCYEHRLLIYPCVYTVRTARLIYHLNMEMTLLHSNPCGIFPLHFLLELCGNASSSQEVKAFFHWACSKTCQWYMVLCFKSLPLMQLCHIQTQIYQLHMEVYHLLIVISYVETGRVGCILFILSRIGD